MADMPGIFEFTPTTYVDRVWYLSWEGTDLMACLYRDSSTSPWRLTYRFRYYADAESFNSEDRKSVYELTSPDGEESSRLILMHAFDGLTAVMAEHLHADRTCLVVQGGSEKTLRLLSRQPWGHVRITAPPGNTVQ